ncbi:MAG: hemerythrin domain-containing protein [Chitinophagaceae bacterium]|nr:hemerythrin domain-containing protein [Chitinophagaceae bacterium]
MHRTHSDPMHHIPLREEHRYGLLFCWRVREGLKQGVDAQRISWYVRSFWSQHLSLHFKDEESALFRYQSTPVFQKMLQDHLLLHDRIMKIISADFVQPGQLTELIHLLDEHIRFEEKELFQYLKTASHKDRELMSSLQLKHLYPDEFWKDHRASL